MMRPNALGPLANYTIRLLAYVVSVAIGVIYRTLVITLVPVACLLLPWLISLAFAVYFGLQVVGTCVWFHNRVSPGVYLHDSKHALATARPLGP